MKKILIVDDDDYFRLGVKALLSKKYDVIDAPNRQVASEILSFDRFDLILSDLHAPFGTAMDLNKWVHLNRSTPMILMARFASAKEVKQAHDLGVKALLRKPLKEDELWEKIHRAFGEAVNEKASNDT